MAKYQHTTPETETALHQSLAKAIDAWLNGDMVDEIMGPADFGYISENVEQRMAAAALAVLLA